MLQKKLWICAISLLLCSSAAQALTLRYSLKKGATLVYKIQVANISRMTGLGQEKSDMSSRIEQVYRLKIMDVTPSGEMEVQQEVISGEIKVSAGDEEHSGHLPKGKIKFRVSPLGKILSNPEGSEEEGNSKSSAMEQSGVGIGDSQTDAVMSAVFIPFSEKEVKPGDSWEEELDESAMQKLFPSGDENQTFKLTVRSELLELTEIKGRKCAKIHTTYELPISGKSSEKESFKYSLDGKLVGEGEWYFAYEDSLTLSAQGKFQMLLKMSADLPPKIQESLPPGMTGDSVVSMKSNLKTAFIQP